MLRLAEKGSRSAEDRHQDGRTLTREADVLMSCVERAVLDKKIGADDLRDLISATRGLDRLQSWILSLFNKYLPNEPPF